MKTLRQRARRAARSVVTLALTGAAPTAAPDDASAQQSRASYWLYVANESSDLVSVVRFDGSEAVEEKTIEVGYHPMDLDGAHGITVSPDGAYWYVSFAHGQPYGRIWKMRTGTDEFVDSVTVGLFPATMALTPDGATLLVVNFNLHGDPVPSSVSTVFTPFMQEVRKTETCVHPHGGRVTSDGRTHYSACMMSDELVEIDVGSGAVSRRLAMSEAAHADATGHDHGAPTGPGGRCAPTWVAPSPDESTLYVPCNGRGDVAVVDRASLAVKQTWPTGRAPYNAAVTPDGSRVVVTLKGAQSVAIFDAATGAERRVPTSRPVTHGVAISPDGRFAFVTNEAVGATRGTLDVLDLERAELVATVELQYQPGGISFWKMDGG